MPDLNDNKIKELFKEIKKSFPVTMDINKESEKKALEGYCILTPIYPVVENAERTEEQLLKLKESHFKKIELSDSIVVVNVNNYIGYSTNLEIEYAKKLGKEIIYYTDVIKDNCIEKV